MVKLHPKYVVGLTDGESSFMVVNDEGRIRPAFSLTNADKSILESVAETIEIHKPVIKLKTNKKPCWDLYARSYVHCEKIVGFFTKNKLIIKREDFKKFAEAFKNWNYQPQFLNKRYVSSE